MATSDSPSPVPRDTAFDATFALWREGYPFIRNRARRYDTDIFRTRLMLQPVICVTGPEAAATFYAPGRLTREGAMPRTVLTLLQDRGSVQMLEGEAHRHRKQLFMSLVASPDRMAALVDTMRTAWRTRMPRWERQKRIVLFNEIEEILCRAVCDWSGVPLREDETEAKARWLGAMIEGTGSIGPRSLRAHLLRGRAERWARQIVHKVRSGALPVPGGTPLCILAAHRNLDGSVLDERPTAVELINVLRPTVAAARFLVFAALALHDNPALAERIRASGDDATLEHFAQEVRRLCPFFPYIGGRVMEPFAWRGHAFRRRDWVILDIFGTNRDARTWNDPDRFDPSRFETWQENAFNFIPQGGGDYLDGHRCPGERLTIELTKAGVELLAREMRYRVPPQDLDVSFSRIPSIPESRFVIADVELAGA